MQEYTSKGATLRIIRAARIATTLAAVAAAMAAVAVAWAASPSPSPAAPQDDWLQTPALQTRLAAGRVVLRSALDARQARASVDAAVRVHASPQSLWPLITQCRYAAILIPGLRHCQQLRAAPDGSWAVIEHDIKYAALLPMVHSVFRAEFTPPLRMDFHRVAGDLKDETGSWILQPAPDGTTTVEYRVSIKPGFWVPRSVIRRSLRRQLPAALLALRTQAEGGSTAHVAAANDTQDRTAAAASGTADAAGTADADANADADADAHADVDGNGDADADGSTGSNPPAAPQAGHPASTTQHPTAQGT